MAWEKKFRHHYSERGMCLKWWSKNHRGKKTVCHLRKVKYLKNHREQSDCTSMITTRICQKQTQILFSIFNLLMDFLASDSVKLRQYVPDCSYWRHVNLFFSFVMSYMPFTTPSLKMRKLICKEVNWQLWNFILSYHDLIELLISYVYINTIFPLF